MTNGSMRGFVYVLAGALALAACTKPDPENDPRLQAAIVEGGVALSTINKCLLHMEQAKNTAAPECDAAKEVGDYESAKQRVKVTDVHLLATVDQKIERARVEAVSAVIASLCKRRDSTHQRLDMEQTDAEIMAWIERLVRSLPGFKSPEECIGGAHQSPSLQDGAFPSFATA